MTIEPQDKTKTTPSDADVLNDALEGKDVKKAAVDDDKAKSKEDKTTDPDLKARQYKNYADALEGTKFWEKKAGEGGDKLKEAKRVNDNLQARLVEIEKALKERKAPDYKPREDDGDGGDDNPLFAELDKRVKAAMDEKLRPLQDQQARRAARQYTEAMTERWGPSWEGLEEARKDLIAEWKKNNMREPELWQYAVIGKRFLDRQITPDTKPTEEGGGGATDKSASVKGAEPERPKGPASDMDVIGAALDGLTKRPVGTSPVAS